MLLKREFHRNLKGLLLWSLILGGLILLMISVYPQFTKDQEALQAMLKAYPEAMSKAFGMDKINITTALGFYAVEGYLIITLFGSIYASMLASSILSKEENEKTIEFLLSKPITRSEIVIKKFSIVVLNIFILNTIVFGMSLMGFLIFDDASFKLNSFLLISAAPLFLHLTFAAITFFISCFIRKSRNILSISMSIVFISYFINIIVGISESLKALKYITFFKYVDAADILSENRLNPAYLLVMIVIALVCFLASYKVYKRKDIFI